MTHERTDSRLDELVRAARDGGTDEAHALSRYLREVEAPLALLERLASDDASMVRMGVAHALGGREEPEIRSLVERLVEDGEAYVRGALSAGWKSRPEWGISDAIALRMIMDESGMVRKAAVHPAALRPSLLPTVVGRLEHDSDWEVRQSAANALNGIDLVLPLQPLMRRLFEDDDLDVVHAASLALETWLLKGEFPAELERPNITALAFARGRIDAACSTLAGWMDEILASEVDPSALAKYGTDLTAEADAGRLDPAYGLDDSVAQVADLLMGEAPRSAIVLGESGTGKTALVHELVRRLATHPRGPVRVLRIAPTEFLVGTRYLGEWETKLQELIDTIRRPKRVVLYIPNVHELPSVGKSSVSETNVMSMLMPSLESGDIAVIGESTPQAFQAGIGRDPSTRRLFTTVEMVDTDDDETRDIALAVCEQAGVELEVPVLDRLLELGAFYLTGTSQPGRTVGLLRRVLDGRDIDDGPLEEGEILETLSQSTGVPLEFLDDRVPLDEAGVRRFLEERVMGQPEAVDAVMDLVTLIKAGLTDPSKPYGVFFFVGPTGVGKTELARALAELIFGNVARLKRFDMSEYATFAAFERLIGAGGDPGLLTTVVKDDPFAVILLDEIEKAHVNVPDLCLQIFDAGRLTDAHGRTSDFRRTIFIMTSNVGSAVETEAQVGFGGVLPPPPDADTTLRVLRGVFRPEFLGRIDRIVQFHQLSEQTAHRIAEREVVRVLERTGITRRELSIDVDPGVVSFLLRRGYSPSLGARPLKRTVEQYILLPVARAIAAGAAQPGSILRLVMRGQVVAVEIEPPGDVPPTPAEGRAVLSPDWTELEGRAQTLCDAVPEIQAHAESVRRRRSELLESTHGASFWNDREGALAVLDEIHRYEGLLESTDMLERRATDTLGHVRQHVGSTHELRERLSALERESGRLRSLLEGDDPDRLADALVTVTRVRLRGPHIDAVEHLATMYAGYARGLRFEVEAISDVLGGHPFEDSISLLVSGVGALTMFQSESGLHQFVKQSAEERGRRATNVELVRVTVLPAPADDQAFRSEDLRVEAVALRKTRGRLIEKPTLELRLLHVPTMNSVFAWTEGPKRTAIQRLMPLLRARVGAPALEADGQGPVIRRYRLGSRPSAHDYRTGQTTGRLGRLFRGELDLLVEPPGSAPED